MSRVQTAIEAANTWVVLAAPIIREYINLGEMVSNLNQTSYKARGPKLVATSESRTYDEAISPIEKAYNTLGDIINGIREDALCDENFYGATTADEEDQEETDNEAVRAGVITFKDAVDGMIKVMNDETVYGKAA